MAWAHPRLPSSAAGSSRPSHLFLVRETAPEYGDGDADALDELEEEVVTLAAHIHAATHRLLTLIAEFDRRRGWELGGHRSCAHWLAFRTGIDLGAAREKVRAARELEALPLTSAAMARGELSFSKVRALTRVATTENEGDLVELARGVTTAQLERMVRAFRKGTREEEAHLEKIRHERRCFSVFPDEDGMYLVRGRLPAEVGALLMRAVEAASDALFREEGIESVSAETSRPTSDSQKRAAQRRADALGLIAERAMEAGFGDGPVSGTRAARYQVVLHVDEDTLAAPGSGREAAGEPGRSELEDGTRVSAETSRRISCDCGVVKVVHGQNHSILDIGRKTRTIPPALRRALEVRDRKCRFPGCGSRFTDAHHVTHWADGGETSLTNTLLLCKHHHRLVHEGGWTVDWWGEGRPVFLDPRGGTQFEGGWEAPEGLKDVSAESLVHDNQALGITSVHQAKGRLDGGVLGIHESGEGSQPIQKTRGDGASRLTLHAHDPGPRVQDQVYFHPLVVAEVEEVWRQSAVGPGFVDLRRDPTLEDGSPERVVPKLLRLSDPQQLTHESGVEEMEFGSFDRSLSDVSVPGRSPKENEAGLQDRDPGTDRVVGDPCIGADGGEVEFRSRAPCHEAEEEREGIQVGDVQNLPDITLHVGRHIVRQPFPRIQPLVEDPRVGSGPKGRKEIARWAGKTTELVEARWEEGEKGHPSCQRLSDGLVEAEVLGSGEDEPARLWALIHLSLEIGEEPRGPLCLMDDGPFRILFQKTTGIFPCVVPYIQRLKGHIALFGEGSPAEGGLSGLPGSGDGGVILAGCSQLPSSSLWRRAVGGWMSRWDRFWSSRSFTPGVSWRASSLGSRTTHSYRYHPHAIVTTKGVSTRTYHDSECGGVTDPFCVDSVPELEEVGSRFFDPIPPPSFTSNPAQGPAWETTIASTSSPVLSR